MTDSEFLTWLSSGTAIPVVLVEASVRVAGSEVTRYLSNRAYVDDATGQAYSAVIVGSPRFPEKISLDSGAAPLTGDITLTNVDGALDGWLGDVWVNRPVAGWMGDVRWLRSDFRPIFSGIAADIDSSDSTRLNIKLRDKLQRLNTPVSEMKIGGAGANKDTLVPVALGECHNVTPVLSNPATLEYQFHLGASERMIEVRDTAQPVSAITTLATGKFTLTDQPGGAITASIQGDKSAGYVNTIAAVIQRLVTAYGKPSERFTAGDIDTSNFAAFEAVNSQPVGLYLLERTNVLSACQQLASSVGAVMTVSRTGLLRLIQIAIPAAGTPAVTITASNMVANSLKPVNRFEVVAGVKVGFCRNYTVQPGLLTSIPEEHKDLFETEWLTETVIDSAVQAIYRLHGDQEMRETCLLRRTDSNAEATRDLNLRKFPRTVYQFDGYPELFMLEIGQPVTLQYSRFGLDAGVPGIVVGFDPDYLTGKVTMEVLV